MADALDSTTASIGRLLSLAAEAALSGMGASVGRADDGATAAVLARVARSRPARDARGRFIKLVAEAVIPASLSSEPTSSLLSAERNSAPSDLSGVADVRHGCAAAPNSGATPDAIRADLDALIANRGHMSTGPVPANDTPLALRGEATVCAAVAQTLDIVPAPLPSLTAALARRRAIFGTVAVDEPDTADAARTLHLRRQLAQAAEHGAALLASLGLPRLVEAGFVPLDRAAIGEAVELVLATLDDIDDDADIEEGGDAEWSLGWTESGPRFCGGYEDREHDTADYELTAPERAGRGFVRCGPDDAEDSDPAERDDEHGSDDAEDFGHHASQHAPRPLRPVDRLAVAAVAARAAELRGALHA